MPVTRGRGVNDACRWGKSRDAVAPSRPPVNLTRTRLSTYLARSRIASRLGLSSALPPAAPPLDAPAPPPRAPPPRAPLPRPCGARSGQLSVGLALLDRTGTLRVVLTCSWIGDVWCGGRAAPVVKTVNRPSSPKSGALPSAGALLLAPIVLVSPGWTPLRCLRSR